ncbi:hypothetical protein [Wolbachia pipientis]|uniref:hypothetical protein n=1 Tax=Wolbachia pipientis TaxID=955 RepID=UPI00202F954A|nr:hypothetical protein [Wolbachia pipientis]MCM1001737.1 hypothetical protein [Wolbachia pipientis]
MLTFKNHRGQFHKMNTALVALTSLYVIGAAVALSSPYWAFSYPVLAPLVAFAATPLGMGILATVTVALIGLAVYAISKNNEVSESKAPKLVNYDGQVMLLVTRDVFEKIKENNKNKDKDGKVIEDQYYVDFNLGGKDYRVIVGGQSTEELGNTLLFETYSLEVKGADDKYTQVKDESKKLEELGLNKDGAKEVNTYLGELSSVTPAQGQEQNK